MALFSYKTLEIKCPRDYGLSHSMQFRYCVGNHGKPVYLTDGCDVMSRDTVCQDCCNALMTMLEQGDADTFKSLVTPNFEVLK